MLACCDSHLGKVNSSLRVDSLANCPVLHLIPIQSYVPNVDIGELADQRSQDDVKVCADDTRDAVAEVGLLQGHAVQDDVDGALGADLLFLKHACSILRQSSNPVCG